MKKCGSWLNREPKCLQNSAVKAADRYRIPIRVLSSFAPGPGTLVVYSPPQNNPPLCFLSGIALDRYQAKLTVSGLPYQNEIVHDLLGAINHASIDVDIIVQNINTVANCLDLSFTIHRDHYEQALCIIQQRSKSLACSQVFGDNAIGKLSLVGIGIKEEHAGMASKVYQALTQQGIGIQLITFF